MLSEQKIVIVEDDPVSRQVLHHLLKPLPSILTQNGAEALDVILNESIDLVLLDIHMPVMGALKSLKD
nr:response regulator [Aliivibrio salmonicida]